MAMPTDRPIRWPAPSNANWKPGLKPLTAAVPTLKKTDASEAATLNAVSRAKPPETREPAMIAFSPRLSAAPVRDASPTFSTSAAATPSG